MVQPQFAAFSKIEISLDSDLAILNAASPASLSGYVVVTVVNHRRFVKRIVVVLKGEKTTRGRANEQITGTSGLTINQRIFRHDVHVGVTPCAINRLNARGGELAWPFRIPLSGAMLETVEIERLITIHYLLYATVEWTSGLPTISKENIPVRLVRVLDSNPPQPDLSNSDAPIPDLRPRVKKGETHGVRYRISQPQEATVYGTFVTLTFDLLPFSAGFKPHSLRMYIVEYLLQDGHHIIPEIVFDRTIMLPDEPDLLVEKADPDAPSDDQWRFTQTLELPKALNVCNPDVNAVSVMVWHDLNVEITIFDPEGEDLQIKASFDLKLYFSRHLLPVARSRTVPTDGDSVNRAIRELEYMIQCIRQPLPLYENHQFDRRIFVPSPSELATLGLANTASNIPAHERSRPQDSTHGLTRTDQSQRSGSTGHDRPPRSTTTLEQDREDAGATRAESDAGRLQGDGGGQLANTSRSTGSSRSGHSRFGSSVSTSNVRSSGSGHARNASSASSTPSMFPPDYDTAISQSRDCLPVRDLPPTYESATGSPATSDSSRPPSQPDNPEQGSAHSESTSQQQETPEQPVSTEERRQRRDQASCPQQ